jgi:UDP-glucose:(heptosyl)LPS alpha-1,3-glucosyltransferase
MRVALVAHHARATGGQDRYALELARHLAAGDRCDVSLVVLDADGDLPASVSVMRVGTRGLPLLLTAPLFRRAAREAIARGRFDVVHAIGGSLPGAQVVTAQFCHAAWREVAGRQSPYQRLVTRQSESDDRAAYRHPALRAVIAVSRRTADEVVAHYGPLRCPVTVIPNGVDPALFAPAGPPRKARAEPVVLFVGAFARKGLDTAIEALALMRTRVLLRAVGGGSAGRFERLARRLGVRGRVLLEAPTRDIAAAFRSADAFVFPSRYDPFGMVVAEALACGVPVVTSRVAGASELVRSGVNGIVVEDATDAAGFAAGLDAVLAERARMSAAAPGAVAGLDWGTIAERTLAVYRTVV